MNIPPQGARSMSVSTRPVWSAVVLFTPALRAETERVACALHALSDSTILPEASYGPKCKKCSLADHCQPRLKSSTATCRSMLWDFVLEGACPT